MSVTLSECYFQSCSTEGNYVFIGGQPMVGNFFAIISIAKYQEKLNLNVVDVIDEDPTDLPLEFTKEVNALVPYYSYSGTRIQGIEALKNSGAIEKQILAQ